MLSLWRNLELVESALGDENLYKTYSNLVSGGIKFVAPSSDAVGSFDQAMLDIQQVRILSISDKYDPTVYHAGLLIYSVDGQTDFFINGSMQRIKSGDILIRQIHHTLTGQDDVYRDLIRELFGTHRINLVGLVFTFAGSGQFSDCMRLGPSTSQRSPMHPLELKLIEMALVSLYLNGDAWMTMPVAAHVDVETLSQSAKKQFLFKLAAVEDMFNKIRQGQQEQDNYEKKIANLPLTQYFQRRQVRAKNNFATFHWTPQRQQIFNATAQGLLDEFYNRIDQTFPSGEFDRDQYAYYDDDTRQLASNLVMTYGRM